MILEDTVRKEAASRAKALVEAMEGQPDYSLLLPDGSRFLFQGKISYEHPANVFFASDSALQQAILRWLLGQESAIPHILDTVVWRKKSQNKQGVLPELLGGEVLGDYTLFFHNNAARMPRGSSAATPISALRQIAQGILTESELYAALLFLNWKHPREFAEGGKAGNYDWELAYDGEARGADKRANVILHNLAAIQRKVWQGVIDKELGDTANWTKEYRDSELDSLAKRTGLHSELLSTGFQLVNDYRHPWFGNNFFEQKHLETNAIYAAVLSLLGLTERAGRVLQEIEQRFKAGNGYVYNAHAPNDQRSPENYIWPETLSWLGIAKALAGDNQGATQLEETIRAFGRGSPILPGTIYSFNSPFRDRELINLTATAMYSNLLVVLGRPDEAMKQMNAAVEARRELLKGNPDLGDVISRQIHSPAYIMPAALAYANIAAGNKLFTPAAQPTT